MDESKLIDLTEIVGEDAKVTEDEYKIIVVDGWSIRLAKQNLASEEYVIIINKLKERVKALRAENKSLKEKAVEEHLAEIEKYKIESTKYKAELDKSKYELKSLNESIAVRAAELSRQQTITAISEKIDKLYAIFPHASGKSLSPAEKGKEGEVLVEDIITTLYPKAVIKRTAHEAAAGDLLVLFNILKCLVEIKNKLIVTRDDLAKFSRDLKMSSVNCALFISLRANRIPDHGVFDISMDNDIPVVFLCLDISQPQVVTYAMEILIYLVKSNESKSKESFEKARVVATVTSSLLPTLKKLRDNVSKSASMVSDIEGQLTRMVSELQ